MKKDFLRLFVAVEAGDSNLARIADATTKMRGLAPDAKWVRQEGQHVTLVFLGDVEEEKLGEVIEHARDVAGKHAPMDLSFAGGGCFGGRKPRVLWVGVRGDVEALARLQKDLTAALAGYGQDKDEHAFHPHLTLARAREARGDQRLASCADALASEDFGRVTLGEVVIFRSELSPSGARYTAMARLPLGAR